MYQSLQSSFSVRVHTTKTSYFHNKISSSSNTCKLFKTFNSLLCPLRHFPPISLLADNFASFFTYRTTTSQFLVPYTEEFRPTTCTTDNILCSFSPLTEVSSVILQHVNHLSYTSTSTHTHHQYIFLSDIFPTTFKQAQVTPQLTC